MPSHDSHKAGMLAGELYRADDPELRGAHLRAQEIIALFNATRPPPPRSGASCSPGCSATSAPAPSSSRRSSAITASTPRSGPRSFINYGSVLLDCNRITIGEDVQLGPGVHIYTAAHPLDAATRISGLEFALPVSIGDGVWLGGGAIVCPGVSIGAKHGGRGRKRGGARSPAECPGSREPVPCGSHTRCGLNPDKSPHHREELVGAERLGKEPARWSSGARLAG
jgi:maltose O-acetyltransferase